MVCAVLGVSRSSFYASRNLGKPGGGKRGPKAIVGDEELFGAIKEVLSESPFWAKGHRKVWARLRRWKNVFASRKRVLRVMRENGLLAPSMKTARSFRREA